MSKTIRPVARMGRKNKALFGFVLATALCAFFLATAASALRADGLPAAPAASSSAVPAVRLGSVDSVIQQAIADKNIPGAVLIVGHDGKVIYRKAYGDRALEPKIEPMTLDT